MLPPVPFARIVPLASALALASCCQSGEQPMDLEESPSIERQSADAEASEFDNASAPAVAFETLAQGAQSGIPSFRFATIRTPAEWQEFWRQHSNRVLPPPPAPAVDFEHAMVLALVAGPRPSAGCAITIERVTTKDDVLLIDAVETAPDPERMVAAVVTTPFHYVRTAVHEGAVELRIR